MEYPLLIKVQDLGHHDVIFQSQCKINTYLWILYILYLVLQLLYTKIHNWKLEIDIFINGSFRKHYCGVDVGEGAQTFLLNGQGYVPPFCILLRRCPILPNINN